MSGIASPSSYRQHYRRRLLLFLITAMLIVGGTSPQTMAAPAHVHTNLLALAQSHPQATIRVIIRHTSSNTPIERAITDLGGRMVRELPLIHALLAELPASAVIELSNTPGVTWVAEDAAVADRACTGCVDTSATISNWLSTVGAKDIWNYAPDVEGQGVTVAVIDSGIANHEDLRWSNSSRRVIDIKPGSSAPPAPAPTGLLSVTAAATPGTVNISSEGTADWARWSWPGFFIEERPWGRVQQISRLSYPQISDLKAFSGTTQYTWNTLSSKTAVALSGGTKSFELTAPADRKIKTLKVYVSVSNGAGTIDAYLSDGSAPPFSTTVQVPTGKTRNYVYTITYSALSNSEELNIAWRPDDAQASVAIAAATLTSGGIDPRPIVATSPDALDQFGHGTHVAGIIGGNGAASAGKVVGIAPMADLINVRVNDAQGQATVADVIDGLEWIYDNADLYNIRVVNMSLNSTVEESYHASALDAAVEMLWFKGIVVVVSAGNNGGNGKLYPPANDPFVITVGATDDKGTPARSDDTIASFSASGVTEANTSKPEIVAPGVNIISLTCTGCVLNTTYTQNQASGFSGAERYFRASGTSMSAAVVSGAVALILQRNPQLDPDQVKQRLLDTGWDNPFGYTGPRYLQVAWALSTFGNGRANTGIPISRAITGVQDSVVWDSAKMGWGSAKMGWGSADWSSSQMKASMTYTMSTMSVNWRKR